jgi:hypothetical protein
MSTGNIYCDALGISAPSVEKAAQSRDACSYGLLIAVLLERGGPVSLEQAAERIAAAGVGEAESVLASLKRCRPARPPVYRNGEQYELDPHDEEASLWAFRLGLKPPKRVPRSVDPKPQPEPLPGPEVPLTLEELAEAWRRYVPTGFSAQRLTVSVLDAHGRTMKPEDVVAYVAERTNWKQLSVESARHWGSNAAVLVREDGLWELRSDHNAVKSARVAVRKLVETERRSGYRQPDRAALDAMQEQREREKEEHAQELERLRRALVYIFPAGSPEAVVMIDVNQHTIESFVGSQMNEAAKRLTSYDAIAGLDVRAILRTLQFDPGARHLHELGPPQKTRTLNRRGRTLKITTELLIRGSCSISRPFGDKSKMLAYLRDGQEGKFRRRVEADAKSLLALYQYGRLHHNVRLRWGFIDETLPAPWTHWDERGLYDLMKRSAKKDVPLEVVVGSALGWEDPWSRARLAQVTKESDDWRYELFDEDGRYIYEPEIQAARLMKTNHG